MIYFVGFERRGAGKYAIATGTIQSGAAQVKVDPISQDLGNAAEAALSEFQKLCAVIP